MLMQFALPILRPLPGEFEVLRRLQDVIVDALAGLLRRRQHFLDALRASALTGEALQ